MEIDYAGSELEMFRTAVNWKNYYGSLIRPYLGARVLEVGAGIGGTTAVLCDGRADAWWCLEPDRRQVLALADAITLGELPACCHARMGTLRDLDAAEHFDTILYIDVLEHIEADAMELKLAGDRLAPGGRLVVLAPAHQWLFSPFDAAVGHYRRYNLRQLSALTPPGLEIERRLYLDACGTLLSLGNRLFLRRSMPTRENIQNWDRHVIPLSRVVDRLLLHRVGKSALAIWQRPAV